MSNEFKVTTPSVIAVAYRCEYPIYVSLSAKE